MAFLNSDLLVEDEDTFEAGKLKPIPQKNNTIEKIKRLEGKEYEKNNKTENLMRLHLLNKE